MDLEVEVLRRLDRGQPFRVAVSLEGLSNLLSWLSDQRGSLPAIAVRRLPVEGGDALIDFAGKDDGWMLNDRKPPEKNREGIAQAKNELTASWTRARRDLSKRTRGETRVAGLREGRKQTEP
jgi:hypothetical protein